MKDGVLMIIHIYAKVSYKNFLLYPPIFFKVSYKILNINNTQRTTPCQDKQNTSSATPTASLSTGIPISPDLNLTDKHSSLTLTKMVT